MATYENPQQLSAIIGDGLRRFRESRGLRQEDIAEMARTYGFTWGRSSVAALEGGNRELSIGELLLIPNIVKKLGGWDEPLVPTNAPLRINDSVWISANQLPSHVLSLLAPTANPKQLEREAAPLEEETLLLGGIENANQDRPETRRKVIKAVTMYEYMYYVLWPEKTGTRYAPAAGSFEINRRVAERITTPDGKRASSALAEIFGFGLYGRPLGDERDARADERGEYETKRALQSARGHVTRELIDELQAEITRRWPEISEVIAKTEEAIATDEGLLKWEKNLQELEERWGEEYYEAASGEGNPKRRRFLRGGK